jgi:hypothetical protein
MERDDLAWSGQSWRLPPWLWLSLAAGDWRRIGVQSMDNAYVPLTDFERHTALYWAARA